MARNQRTADGTEDTTQEKPDPRVTGQAEPGPAIHDPVVGALGECLRAIGRLGDDDVCKVLRSIVAYRGIRL